MTAFELLPTLIALILCLRAAHAEFLAFGPSSGDIDLLGGHANSTELLIESLPGFRICNRLYKSIFISRYGVVSFGAPLRPCCSEWHPRVAPQPVPFVAPLWSNGSPASVSYRTALGEGEVEQVRRRLVQAYNVQHFEPKIVIVVTWVDLACCAVGTLGKQVNNTFQLALVSDVYSAYALFAHDRGGAFRNTPSLQQLEGIVWWAGFNLGDGRYFALPWQQTSDNPEEGVEMTDSWVFTLTDNFIEATDKGKNFHFAFSENQGANFEVSLHIMTESEEEVTVRVSALGGRFSQTVRVSKESSAEVEIFGTSIEDLVLTSTLQSDRGVRVRVLDSDPNKVVSVTAFSELQYQSGGILVPSVEGYNLLQFASEEVTYYAIAYSFDNPDEDYTSFMIIVGQHDSTVVRVTPNQAAQIGSRFSTTVGQTKTVVLNHMETLMVKSTYDLTGSKVTAWSGKPIAFYCGHTSTEIPHGVQHDDFIGESVPPVGMWDKCYNTAPLLTRRGFDLYRVLAAFSATHVTVDCWRQQNHTHLNFTLSEGEFWESSYNISHPEVISSEHFCTICGSKPILVVQFSTGAFADLVADANPSMIVVPAISSYGNSVTMTLGPIRWNSYDEYVNLILPVADLQLNLISVGASTLDSLPVEDVTPLPPADPRYYVVRFKVPTFPRTVTIKHANPLARMGVTVYGLAQFTSYGYTAGFDKQSDILVVAQDGNAVPNNGYAVVEPPATLYCYINPDMYEGGSGVWVGPAGREVPQAGEAVYQENSSASHEVLLHVRSEEGLTEGYYHCRASVAGSIERQIRVGVFVTPPAPSEVVSLATRPLNGSAILLQWEPPLEPYGVDLVGYTVVVYQTETAQYMNFDLPGNATEFVVGKLHPSTPYTVGVYATSRTGAGPASFMSPVMTLRLTDEVQHCPQLTLKSQELRMEFDAHSHYIPVPLGTSFTVQCTCAMLISSSEPQWVVEDRIVGQDPSSSVYQDVGVRESELVIKNFTVELAGHYICQDFSVEDDFYLIPVDSVQRTEIPFILSPPFSYGAELGTKVALSCGVRGEGITGVSWEAKSGRTFPTIMPGKPLILENIGLEAGDEYRCVVHTQEGDRVVSQYARVAIYGTPILLSEGDPGLTVVETHNLTLTCLVAVEKDAVHSPKLAWYYDDANLLEDGHRVSFEHTFLSNQTVETEDGKNMHKFTVSLVNVARDRAGVYECRLFHQINITHSRAVFNVTVHYKPQNLVIFPREREVLISRFSFSQLALQCSVVGRPVPLMLWSRDGQKVVESTTEVLGWTIDPQQPEASGRYTCIAASLLGVVETSLIVNITDVKIVSNGQVHENNSYITVGSDYPRNISCLLQGIQPFEANVTWFYPSGLAVPLAAAGSSIHQVDTNSSSDRRVESILVWSPQLLDGGSFNGDGFYSCRISTPRGVQDTVFIGVFHQDPIPGPPSMVSMERTTGATLRVRWSPPLQFPHQFIQDYTLRHYKLESGALVPQKAVSRLDPTVLEYMLVDVEPGADHTVGVSAGSKGGPGPMVISRPVSIAEEATYGQPCETLVVQVQIPPTPVDSRGNAKVALGENVAVFCFCQNTKNDTITRPEWIVNEQTLTTDTDQHRHFFYLSRTTTAVLRVTGFTLDDVDTYTCVDYGVKKSITLLPQDTDTDLIYPVGAFLLPMAIVALPGATVQLPCALEEEYPGELSWRETGGKDIPLALPSSRLYIGSFQQSDSGNYTCHLESEAGMRTSAPLEIRTYDAPVLTGSTTVQVMKVGLGRTFGLLCQVANDPLALDRVRFAWFYNNRRVFAGGQKIRQLLRSENGSRVTSSTLQVVQAEPLDEGNYLCVASNLMGSVSVNFSVTVHPGPSNLLVTPPGPIELILGDDLEVNCSASGDPVPLVTWIQVGASTANPLSQGLAFTSLRISNVLAENDGVYRCTALNTFGVIQKDIRILVQDACESEGITCDHQCRNIFGVWQCACKAGSTLTDRRGTCKTCGIIPFRQPLSSIDQSSFPSLREVPPITFRRNYYTTPWTVAFCDTSRNKLVCGGVLINSEWVLTLGSCVCNRETHRGLTAVFLDPFTIASRPLDGVGAEKRCLSYPALAVQVLEIVCHPTTTGNTVTDSAALVRVQPVPVQSACLPSATDIANPPSRGQGSHYFPNIEGGIIGRFDVFYHTTSNEACQQGLSPSSPTLCIRPTRAPCNRLGGTTMISFNSQIGYWYVTGLFNGHLFECSRHVDFEQHVSVYPYVEWVRNVTKLHNY